MTHSPPANLDPLSRNAGSARKDPNARNVAAVFGSEENDLLKHCSQFLEHSCLGFATHESQSQLFKQYSAYPEHTHGIILIKMLPKIWHHREGVLIGVFMLKLISHEDILAKVSKGAQALCSAARAYSRSPISVGAEAAASFFLSTQLLGPN